MVELVRSSFVATNEKEELGWDLGLTTTEIAKSLEADPTNVRRKLKDRGFLDRIKEQGFRILPIGRVQGATGPGYQEYVLDVDAAKFFVAKYDSPIGDAYLAYLINLDKKVDELKKAALTDPLLAQIQQSALMRFRQLQTEKKVVALEERVAMLDGDSGYNTVLAFARREDIYMSVSRARKIGIKAAKICKERKIPIGTVPDERFGQVNSYPRDILNEVLDSIPEED